jgi:hypothetical protein
MSKMKKLPLVLMLFSVPMYSQMLFTTIRSTPIYSHGELLPLVTDATHNINVISRVMAPIRKRYLRVFVGVRNTSTTGNLDFEPSGITLLDRGGNSTHPMDAVEVRDMAKGTARRTALGVVGAMMLLDFNNSMANAHNQNMRLYQQMRTDDMSDAAFQKIGDDFVTIQKSNLLRSTVFPGEKLEGFVYFDLGKNGAISKANLDYVLSVPLGEQIYKMDFTDAPYPATSQPANQEPPAFVAQPIVAPVATTVPTQGAITIVQITSQPVGADIELDGKFAGDTPSEIEVPAGDHTVRLTKDGFTLWEKKIHTTGGNVTINAGMKSPYKTYREQ